MYQIQGPGLRPLTTAHLAQTMTLLNQPIGELYQQIQQELTNPALELVEERRCPTCHRALPVSNICPVCARPTSQGIDGARCFYIATGGFSRQFVRREPGLDGR